ncbi:MAG: ABC transporter permease [Gammaproteobacteria bacterium]|nr:ABC transporter permease [Gammaproteobacteria bacterium]
MLNYLASRIISALFVVLGVSCLVFLLIHLVPGDPIEMMLGESARPADREALRAALGLDLPVLAQLGNYLTGLLSFDLGQSIHYRLPISELLAQRIPATAQLAVISILVAVSIAIPLGAIAAVNKGTRWDHIAMSFSLFGVSIPNFWMGPLLIMFFSLWMGLLPVSGNEGLSSMILPAITLGTSMAAILARMVRSTLLEVLNEDYIRTARAKGLTETQVIWRHGLRNAMLPVITLVGLQLGTLLGGAVITETIFSWPGVGQLTIEAIQRRDYPVVQACVLLISLSYVVVNVLTDIVYALIDPRIRLGDGE